VLKTGVLGQTEKHNLQSYLEFMVQIEALSWWELTEANQIDEKTQSRKIFPLMRCWAIPLHSAMANSNLRRDFNCVRHNLVDELARNKSVVRQSSSSR